MEKRKTPVSTVIFYIIGIILLIVSAFMLWTAVNYTKTYLQSYDASFADMWSNSVQYIITQFLPYCGMGVICLGLGRAIKGTAPLKQAEGETAEADAKAVAPDAADEKKPEAQAAAAAAVSGDQVDELVRRIDTNREVLSIKIEEKEKRDSFRIKELEKKVEGFLSDVKYINEPLEELVYKQAVGEDLTEPEDIAAAEPEAAAEPADTGAAQESAAVIPQVFRVARNMTMPACPAAAAVPETPEAAPSEAATRPARGCRCGSSALSRSRGRSAPLPPPRGSRPWRAPVSSRPWRTPPPAAPPHPGARRRTSPPLSRPRNAPTRLAPPGTRQRHTRSIQTGTQ